jgi:hypothetical protein
VCYAHGFGNRLEPLAYLLNEEPRSKLEASLLAGIFVGVEICYTLPREPVCGLLGIKPFATNKIPIEAGPCGTAPMIHDVISIARPDSGGR